MDKTNLIIGTLTLETEMSFTEALRHLEMGKCIGIKPKGSSGGFLVKYKPHWMNEDSDDNMLCWNRSVTDGKGAEGIRTKDFLGKWYLVVIDTNSLPDKIKLQFVLSDITNIV